MKQKKIVAALATGVILAGACMPQITWADAVATPALEGVWVYEGRVDGFNGGMDAAREGAFSETLADQTEAYGIQGYYYSIENGTISTWRYTEDMGELMVTSYSEQGDFLVTEGINAFGGAVEDRILTVLEGEYLYLAEAANPKGFFDVAEYEGRFANEEELKKYIASLLLINGDDLSLEELLAMIREGELEDAHIRRLKRVDDPEAVPSLPDAEALKALAEEQPEAPIGAWSAVSYSYATGDGEEVVQLPEEDFGGNAISYRFIYDGESLYVDHMDPYTDDIMIYGIASDGGEALTGTDDYQYPYVLSAEDGEPVLDINFGGRIFHCISDKDWE